MEKLECPRCHQRTIPAWRKQVLGPATSATCPGCGGKVGVPMAAILSATPFFAALIAFQFIESFALGAAVLVVGAVAMAWLHQTYVPLIPK